MDFNNFIFIGILVIILLIPVYFIFSGKTGYIKNFRYVLPAIFVSAFLFLLWDIKFTDVGIWSYKEKFTLGVFHKGLPLEQWLFYFIVPFSALFVYEFLKERRPNLDYNNVFTAVSLILLIVFAIVAYKYRLRFYTFFCFLFAVVYFAYVIFRRQFKGHLTHFFFSYFVMLVPYLILSGFLTWSTAVEYHQEQVLNVWIMMVPIENLVYLFLLLIINTTVYEYLAEKKYF